MEEDWEQLADKPKEELVLPTPVAATDANKWAGEDEEEEVKDSWEDDEDEKKDEEKVESAPVVKVKPKSKLQDKIAEKERLEAEREEEERFKNMTPEERTAEKLRLQKLQEAADLKLAMDTLGITADAASVEGSIDGMVPTSKAEFTQLAQLISNRVSLFREKDEFPNFVEELVKNISLHLSSIDIKRIKNSVDNLYIEKQKIEKEKTKKPKKGAGKPKLRMESNAIDEGFTRFNGNDGYDEMDDFM